MNEMKEKIAESLEASFVERGFTEPGVAELRDRAGVSSRTLYKHFPSRDAMVLAALERRNIRFMELVFPSDGEKDLESIFARIGHWMAANAPRGCMLHAAVAAHPSNPEMRALLEQNKEEVSAEIARLAGLEDYQLEILLIYEGMLQMWAIKGEEAVTAAQRLGRALLKNKLR